MTMVWFFRHHLLLLRRHQLAGALRPLTQALNRIHHVLLLREERIAELSASNRVAGSSGSEPWALPPAPSRSHPRSAWRAPCRAELLADSGSAFSTARPSPPRADRWTRSTSAPAGCRDRARPAQEARRALRISVEADWVWSRTQSSARMAFASARPGPKPRRRRAWRPRRRQEGVATPHRWTKRMRTTAA